LARSTDTFFYKVGAIIGPEKIARWAEKFGMNDLTGIDIPAEVKGLIPTPDGRRRQKMKIGIWEIRTTWQSVRETFP